jgi:alpha-tubulin suppressor-like RCC1 family protein
LAGFNKVTKVFASANNTAFVDDDYLYVSGDNKKHKLGTYPLYTRYGIISQPVQVVDNQGQPIMYVSKVCIANEHMLILANGLVYVSGNNDKYRLGFSKTPKTTIWPQVCTDLQGMMATDIAVTDNASFVIADNKLYWTGTELFMRIGDGPAYSQTFTYAPLFQSSANIEQVEIRTGDHSGGLIISTYQ